MNELKPEMLTLTEQQKNDNCWRIKYDGAVSLDERVKTAKNYLDQSAEKMLQDIKGHTLSTHAKIVSVQNSQEKKVVATKEIPTGTLLGLYFGEPLTPNASSHENDISKTISLGKNTFVVNGKLNGKQTIHATMNHAFDTKSIDRDYVFSNEKAKKLSVSENVLFTYIKVTVNGIPYELDCFIAAKTIVPGNALHWNYKKGYFDSRPWTPLLFDKSGEFLNKAFYFPRQLNISTGYDVKTGAHAILKVSYTLVPDLMGSDSAIQQSALQQLKKNNSWLFTNHLPVIQTELSKTGFTTQHHLEHMKTHAEQEANALTRKRILLYMIGIVGTLIIAITEENSSSSFSFFSPKKLMAYGALAVILFALNKFWRTENSIAPNTSSHHQKLK